MKALKFFFSVFAFFICVSLAGQTVHRLVDVILSDPGINYGGKIGIVTGTLTYKFSFRYSEEGKLISMHWNVVSCDLVNDKGYKVKQVDSGHDTYGIIWDLFNNIDSYNAGYPIEYVGIDDGWLNDVLPEIWPEEGVMVDMSCKLICRGEIFPFGCMFILHMNANGEITAEVEKNPFW